MINAVSVTNNAQTHMSERSETAETASTFYTNICLIQINNVHSADETSTSTSRTQKYSMVAALRGVEWNLGIRCSIIFQVNF